MARNKDGKPERVSIIAMVLPTTGNTKSWRQGFGHESNFQGVSYKGSASNLQFFFPIFHYFLEGCVGRNGSMQEELKSMRALRRVTLEQRVVSHQAQPSMDKLIRLNVEHQHLTKAVYGYDAIRPKHHVRFHQPLQHFRAGFYVDCFPCEKNKKCSRATLVYTGLTHGLKAAKESTAIWSQNRFGYTTLNR